MEFVIKVLKENKLPDSCRVCHLLIQPCDNCGAWEDFGYGGDCDECAWKHAETMCAVLLKILSQDELDEIHCTITDFQRYALEYI